MSFDKIQSGDGTGSTVSTFNTELDNSLSAMNSVVDKSDKLIGEGITGTNTILNNMMKNLESQKEANKQLYTSDALDDARDKNIAYLETMQKFMANDKTMVEAQQKLLNALKPHGTANQRFWGYVADFGANIAASDADNLSQAAGQAMQQTLSDVKFDKKEDRDLFIKKQELIMDFELKKRQNTVKAMEFQAQINGTKVSDELAKLEARQNQARADSELDSKMATLGIQGIKVLNDMNNSLLDNINKRNTFKLGIEELKSNNMWKEAEFKESQLKRQQDFMIQQVNQLTNEQKNFNYRANLPEEEQVVWDKINSKATKQGVTPDVTSRAMYESITKRIKELGGSPDVAKAQLGDKLYNMVKLPNGNVDDNKLFAIIYNNVGMTQMTGGAFSGGGGAATHTYTSSGGLTKN